MEDFISADEWHIPPEVQAERDDIAQKMRAYEVANPEPGSLPSDVTTIENQVTKIAGNKVNSIEPDFIPVNQSSQEPDFIPVSHTTPDFIPVDKVADTTDPAKDPGFLKSVAQPTADLVGALGKTLSMAAGGVAGLVSQDAGDAIFKAGDEFKDATGKVFLSEEDRKNQTYAEKLSGSTLGMVPTAVSALVAPIPTAIGLATNELFNTPAELLKRGVDLQRAEASGLISAVFMGGANLLPALGSTYLRSAMYGGAGNAATGIATDLALGIMFPDRPDVQKDYTPGWEKTSLQFAGGATLGVGFHKLHNYHVAQTEARKAAITETVGQQLIKEVLPQLDASMPDLRPVYRGDPNKSRTENLKTLIDQGVTDGTRGKITQALDLIAKNEELPAHQQALAEGLNRLALHLGLDNIEVHPLDKDTNPELADAVGHYNKTNDRVELISDRPAAERLARTVLHETIHAITNKAGRLFEEIRNNPEAGKNLDPHQQMILKKVSDINDVFEKTRDKVLEKRGMLDTLGDDPIMRNSYFDRMFIAATERAHQFKHDKNSPEFKSAVQDMVMNQGLKNIHEYMSEIVANPEDFGSQIKELPLNTSEVPFLNSSAPRSIKNMWHAGIESVKRLLGIPNGANLYSLGFDHVTGLIEMQKASSRFAGLKDVTLKVPEKGLAAAMLRRVAGLAANAHTKEELGTRLSIMSDNPVWTEWVRNNTDRIWQNSHDLFEAAMKSDYKSLHESMQKFVGDDRTLDQFIHEDFDNWVDAGKVHKFLTKKEDLKGVGRQLFSPTILNVMKDGFGAKIMRFVNHKAVEYKSMGEILYHKALENMQPFNTLKMDRQLALMDTISFFDKPSQRLMLQKQNLQWLSDEMLSQRGHSPQEIEAYHGITAMEDFLHSLMNQARVKEGKAPIEQIPGYMPHNFPGAYKVLVKLILPKEKGSMAKGNEFIVAVRGFATKFGAQHYADALKTGKYDTHEGMLRPMGDNETGLDYKVRRAENLSDSLMGGIEEHLTAYRNGLVLQPDTLQALEKIELDNMRGMTKHALERSDVSGYTGEMGQSTKIKEKVLGLVGHGENNRMLKTWQNYAKNITDYYRNTMFVDEVMSPLTADFPLEVGGKTYYHHLLENTKELRKHLNDFGFNFTGKNVNHAKWIDEAMQDLSEKIGVDPMLYRHGIRTMRNFLSMIKLRGNPGNYAANFFQPMHMMAMLELSNVLMRRDGVKIPNTFVSMSKGLLQMHHPDTDMMDAMAWARHNHHLDAQLEYELHDKTLAPVKNFFNKITGGPVNATIESFGRSLTFTIGYAHFREVFPDNPQRARDAAANLMKMTMVDYDTTQRPLMYQNYGSAGESLSPFAVFRNGYVGNTLLMLKLLKNRPMTDFGAFKPLLLSQLTYLASAGMIGIIGASEWDLIVKTINALWPEKDLPTIEELMFKAKAPDWLTFGALSAATKHIPGMERGIYMGSSMNAVGVDDTTSAALVPFVQAVAVAATLGVDYAASLLAPEDTLKTPPAESFYKAQRQLTPGVLQPWIERFHYMDKESNVGPQTSSLEGGVDREPSDWVSMYLGGRRSMGEQKEASENRILAQKEQRQKDEIKRLVAVAVDKAIGMNKNQSYDALQQRAAELGMSPQQFAKAVASGRMNRLLSQRVQEANRRTLEGAKLREERERME